MNSKKVSGFNKFISNQDLLDYLKSVSIKRPTQIQSDCILKLLDSKNYTVQGKTGSGKTLGYLLPIIQKLKELENDGQNNKVGCPKVVILLPTRELALQIFQITKTISHFAKLRIRKLVGGDKGRSLESLYNSQIDILITTPTRALRTFKNKELSIENLRYLVFDEADQLLEHSFEKTTKELASILQTKNMQIFLVIASRPVDFDKSINEFFPKKKFITIGKGEENILNHKVKTYNITLENDDKFVYVLDFIKKQKKRNGIIFVGNKARSKRVFEIIGQIKKDKLFLLHKDLTAKERILVVDKFRKAGGILVSTDIFARGIDIAHLQWILNFDLPSDADYYLHRTGRVGRAGRSGDVFNFITSKDDFRQQKINDALTIQGREDLRLRLKPKKV